MVGDRRRTASSSSKTAPLETASVKDGIGDDSVIVLDDDSSFESEVAKLRGRWELASVLNFLTVFGPVIGSDLKITAEEIEMGLIRPNRTLAQLHIALLKGIPPVSKTLNVPDTWVTVLCKKLAMWWPWVAEGEIPLTAANGKEIFGYKQLDPTNRLLILKALCEIRADQDDTVSHVNDSLKQGTEISCFRKSKIGGDGNGTSYWYDGSTIIGYRLYREVNKTESKSKTKGKACLPTICFKWETLATNLEEFRKVTDELSSSKVVAEVAVGKTIGSNAVPVVEKIQKKKERALKRRQRQEALMNGFRNSYGAGITRSCRSRRPINYTFDDYDRAIDEAIQINKKSKTVKEQRQESKHVMQGKIVSNGSLDTGTDSKDSSGKRGDSTDSDTGSGRLREAGNDDVDNDDAYDSKEDDDNDNGSEWEDSDKEQDNHGDRKHAAHIAQKPVGVRWSERLAGVTSHPVVETKNLDAKNRLRQRPTRNSALDTVVVPDSDDENSSEHANNGISGHENYSPVVVPDSDDENSSEHANNGISGLEKYSPVADSEDGSDS